MATSPMAIQFVYVVSIMIGWHCWPYVNWREFRRGRYMAVLYTTGLFSAIAYSTLSLLVLSSDCAASPVCTRTLSVVMLFFDAYLTVCVELVMIKRMEILVDPSQKKWLFVFYGVPLLYPFNNLLNAVGLFGVTFDGQSDIINAFNILVPINALLIESLLAYNLHHGRNTARFARHKLQSDVIYRGTVALCIGLIAFAVFAVFVTDLGVALIYVLTSTAFYVIGKLNRLIIKAFQGGVSLSVDSHGPSSHGNTRNDRTAPSTAVNTSHGEEKTIPSPTHPNARSKEALPSAGAGLKDGARRNTTAAKHHIG